MPCSALHLPVALALLRHMRGGGGLNWVPLSEYEAGGSVGSLCVHIAVRDKNICHHVVTCLQIYSTSTPVLTSVKATTDISALTMHEETVLIHSTKDHYTLHYLLT